MTQAKVDVIPLTLPKANAIVDRLHRHHAALPAGFGWFCVGAVVNNAIVGCAIAGRPTNRNNDNGQTVEVLRLASDGTANVCSALLGACARAAKAIGAQRIITYTLSSEGGASLRGAGWICENANTGRSFWGNGNTRAAAVRRAHFDQSKARWALVFRSQPIVVLHAENIAQDIARLWE